MHMRGTYDAHEEGGEERGEWRGWDGRSGVIRLECESAVFSAGIIREVEFSYWNSCFLV
jgi:hypothetical protein